MCDTGGGGLAVDGEVVGAGAGAEDGSEQCNQGADFPGVDDASIRRPPRRNEPRERTLPDGTQVKWCPECGKWGDHFRGGASYGGRWRRRKW